jgi:hypothetical protein
LKFAAGCSMKPHNARETLKKPLEGVRNEACSLWSDRP